MVVVQSAGLNIRKGPGTAYAVVAAVRKGDALRVVGQTGDCGWLKVSIPAGEGWVLGSGQYVTLTVACSTVPVVAVPPTPTAPPTARATAIPAPVDLTNADWQTIARVVRDNAKRYRALMVELQALLQQEKPNCRRLVQILDALATAPQYKELARGRLYEMRDRPGLEGQLWDYVGAYGDGLNQFRLDTFRSISAGCAAGQVPTGEQRQAALHWIDLADTISKMDHAINHIEAVIGP